MWFGDGEVHSAFFTKLHWRDSEMNSWILSAHLVKIYPHWQFSVAQLINDLRFLWCITFTEFCMRQLCICVSTWYIKDGCLVQYCVMLMHYVLGHFSSPVRFWIENWKYKRFWLGLSHYPHYLNSSRLSSPILIFKSSSEDSQIHPTPHPLTPLPISSSSASTLLSLISSSFSRLHQFSNFILLITLSGIIFGCFKKQNANNRQPLIFQIEMSVYSTYRMIHLN